MDSKLDYLILGPAHPYRGGIADTNNALASALQKEGFSVKIWTFTQLYPNWIFPGTSQFTKTQPPEGLSIKRALHTYNPFNWIRLVKALKKEAPEQILFRYHTPFLAPCYSYISRRLKDHSQCVAIVDNWKPHETSLLDRLFGSLMKSGFSKYISLSNAVANEMKTDGLEYVYEGFHPIADNIPPLEPKEKARKELGWQLEKPIVLFYGLIRPYKGLDLLLKAFDDKPLKNTDIQLAVVGEFYESRKRYQTALDRLVVSERLYLHPEFASETLTQQVFSAADIVILPYRSASQSGIIPLAYHYHKPIIVTDRPGLKQIIEVDQTGWVCSPNALALSETLVTAFKESPKTKKEKLLKAREKYSWKKFAQWLDTACNS
ncbi:MAG: glycosyltransferase [Flavobacteriales bacterium]|jgi:D-inositol-3-phosphate glycosyltransferase|nr:glycosyltransferase [Flavobacteriales bacterium]